MLSTAVGPLVLARGAKLICWQQDVFPEVAQRYGVPGTGGLSGALLRGIRNRSLAKATRIVAIGERMAEHLRTLEGVNADRVEVIHNWADGNAIRPIGARDNALRSQWKLEGKFVVGYSGNLGRVHEFNTLLDAAHLMRDSTPDVVFLIVGRGPRLAEVLQRALSLGLSNVRFEPHQPLEMLSQSLTVPDVHISALQPRFEGLVHPSKLYGVMASGRPTLFIGDVGGESARILAAAGAGVTVGVGDHEKLATTIHELRDSPERCERMGTSARRVFEAQFDRPVAFSRWEALLDRVAN
jgi:glycosyltransferase involved in cell wall biosynthesis